MKARRAQFWVGILLVLVAVIFVYERYFYEPPKGLEPLLPGFRAPSVVALAVSPSGQAEIRVEKTNDEWRLTSPLSYPARSAPIETLLTVLERLGPSTTITAEELEQYPKADEAYSFDKPQSALLLTTTNGSRRLVFGDLTAPGDSVFVRVEGVDGVFVVDAELLSLLPSSPKEWRDRRFFRLSDQAYDSVAVKSEGRLVKLSRDPSTQVWRLVHPMQARADGELLTTLMQGLKELSVSQFITDDPRADLEGFGLRPPRLAIEFLMGTNVVQALRFGRVAEGTTNQVYAGTSASATVTTVPLDPLRPWRGAPNDFRQRRLVTLTEPLTRVDVRGQRTDSFTLSADTNGLWSIAPGDYPADEVFLDNLSLQLGSLEVVQFVKDVVTEPDLPAYGLASPTLSYGLGTGLPGETNGPVLRLDFGREDSGKTFVRRSDEMAVYAVRTVDAARLPTEGWRLRDRRLWRFPVTNVVSLVVRQGERRWQVNRQEENKWTLAAGSQGLINDFAVEETAFRLGTLTAVVWVAPKVSDVSSYGLDGAGVQVSVVLKGGMTSTVTIGEPAPSGHHYAMASLGGEDWVFEFPAEVYDYVQTYLIRPSHAL